MKTFLDCFPCFLKQAIECARLSSDDPHIHRKTADRIMKILLNLDAGLSPPSIAREVYAEIKNITGNEDPYCQIKKKDNRQMMDMYKEMKKLISGKNSLYMACKISAGGNMIDSGTGRRKDSHGSKEINDILKTEPVQDDFRQLEEGLENSRNLLFIGDNAGEIVADKLLIREIQDKCPKLNIKYAVRELPVINDATMNDALEVGMDKLCEIISNGDSAPGTELRKCSKKFKEIFSDADLIISKGQGNFETLSGNADNRIFFLLIAKCPVIAQHLDVPIGSMLIKKNDKSFS